MKYSFLVWMCIGCWVCVSAQPQTDSLIEDINTDSVKWAARVHPLALENDEGFVSFEPLDTVVSDYAFFFTGEVHRKKINTQLQLNFLLYLHQTAGVRNLIIEGGFSYGYLLDVYVRTGNEKILDKVMAVAPICPGNMRKLFQNIREYNQKLSKSERIRIMGIDIEHAPELSLQVLHSFLPDKDPPKSLRKRINRIVKAHRSKFLDEADLKNMFRDLYEDMERREEIYETYWGKKFPLARLIVENTVQGYDFNWVNMTFRTDGWIDREERMYDNFLVVQPFLRKGACYGQFGAFHAQLAEGISWDFPTIARKLNQRSNSPVQGKVMAITRYLRDFSSEYERWSDNTELKDMVKFIEKCYPNRVVLCRLVGSDTPFKEMSKAFQYMIYIDEDLEEIQCR
ncbi:MAG: erythromycin esterase family protein [Bacteroidota bacterium]